MASDGDEEVARQARRYRQIQSQRTKIRREWAKRQGDAVSPLDCPEGLLPQYDDKARAGWAKYQRQDRGDGAKRGRPRLEVPCGTVQRYRQHIDRRRELRNEGKNEAQIDMIEPSDGACREANSEARKS